MTLARCPACRTVFRVRPDQLLARRGHVRCGQCYASFNALDHLLDEPAPVPAAPILHAGAPATPPPDGARREPGPAPRPEAENRLESYGHAAEAGQPGGDTPCAALRRRPRRPAAATAGTVQAVRRRRGETRAAAFADRLASKLAERNVDADRFDPAPAGPAAPPPQADRRGADDDAQDVTIRRRGDGEAKFAPPKFEPRMHDRAGCAQSPAGHAVPDRPPADDAFAPPPPHLRPSPRRRSGLFAPILTPPRARGLQGLAAGILLGALAVQAAYVLRAPITRAWPALRPAYLAACEHFGCDVPLPRVAEEIAIESSGLQSYPARRAGFFLGAAVRNRADYPQAYPHLELTLTDTGDRALVRRVLAPAEWAGDRVARDGERGFAPGAEVEFELPFTARGVAAAGYRLYVFYP